MGWCAAEGCEQRHWLNPVLKAAKLHDALCVRFQGTIRYGKRSEHLGRTNAELGRFAVCMLLDGLDALFGAEDGTEVTYKLAQQIALS
jgi:hypothetical protein